MARQNPFQQLRAVSEGPEAEFEAVCADLIRTQYPEAKRVRVHRGDGGVDAAHGDWGTEGALDVFQVKYLPDVLGDSQKQQIRESYNTAHANPHFKLRKWILCIPTILRQEDHAWFDTWKNEQDTHIELWDGDKLETLLRLPAASASRERLKTLGVAGLPSPASELLPSMHARQLDKTKGTSFVLQIDLTNSGDQAAENLRVVVEHTRETHHVAFAPFVPWKHENVIYNPRELSLPRSLNPGESITVLVIPFGMDAPLQARIRIAITSLTTRRREWFAQVSETDIVQNSSIRLVPDTRPWPVEEAKKPNDEPQSEVARQLLDKMHEHPDPESRGLTEILTQVPGQIGVTMFHPSILIYGKHQVAGFESDTFEQAVAELISLGWLKDKGVGLSRHQYTLVKTRAGS
jgi:hypothetical protein